MRWAPGISEGERGAAGEPKKGWGLFVIIWFTAKGAKTAKNPTARALGSLWRSISSKLYFDSHRQRTNTTYIPHSGTAGYPFILKAPQKRLPAPTPQGRVELIEMGTRHK